MSSLGCKQRPFCFSSFLHVCCTGSNVLFAAALDRHMYDVAFVPLSFTRLSAACIIGRINKGLRESGPPTPSENSHSSVLTAAQIFQGGSLHGIKRKGRDLACPGSVDR